MRFAVCVLSCMWILAADAQAWRGQVGALAAYDAASVREAGDWLVQNPASGARLLRGARGDEIVLTNGLLARTFRLAPNAATVGFDQLTSNTSLIRGVKPEAMVEIDGTRYEVGGLKGQPNYAFLRPEWLDSLTADTAAFQFEGFEAGPIELRMAWAQVRHHAPDATWPPKGVHLRMDYSAAALPGVTVSVHYELYDAVPLMSKWISVRNGGAKAITINSFTCEVLAAVEYASDVDDRVLGFPTPNIHVESDYSFGGMSARDASREAVHWVEDPEYKSQVSYPRKNPCLLEVRPTLGPEQAIEPGAEFVSFRAFEMPFDSYERERNSLAVRRMYRTIAPWVTENPLMLHVRYADWDTVKNAVDQCADVGFEMIILTFGSGANLEDRSPENIAKLKGYTDYARSKGIEFGTYSLLASRSIDAANDVVMPAGETPTFGHSPCLQSEWGRNYFDTLYKFYEATGFALLEHDGSYPGDPCTSTAHPGHRGYADSRWTQWKEISDFYAWCLGRGIYLNVPDFYFLAGSTKCGMGYREENWSLPREQQVIHSRQNIFDGLWEKTPSMGWMFVPLTEYHGGGAAATIEPLKDHLDHYRAMVQSNLAFGVQACYRGPRLYDAPETRDMLKTQVDWFKAHRAILESDVVHGRRADGRDVDWALHVNPALDERGMLVAFNPLNETVTRTLRVNVYYTGLRTAAMISEGGAAAKLYAIDGQGMATIETTIPAHGFAWWSLRATK